MDNSNGEYYAEGLYNVISNGSSYTVSFEKPKEDKMEYKELKTIFKEYIVHHRTVTICVKEVREKDRVYSGWYYSEGANLPMMLHKRTVTIGISICNPEDEYNSQFGKQIAEGRAKKALEKENELMYIVGYLRDTPQSKNKFVLSQFAETAYYHFKHNPEKYIVNFNKTIEDG